MFRSRLVDGGANDPVTLKSRRRQNAASVRSWPRIVAGSKPCPMWPIRLAEIIKERLIRAAVLPRGSV
jgi:hypothetical protein